MKIKVKVDRMGNLDLVSQNGDFAGGKAMLEALLASVQAMGVNAQQTGQVETHNHDVLVQYTSATTGNIAINQAITEDGPPHTH
jgi:hypothetical protein